MRRKESLLNLMCVAEPDPMLARDVVCIGLTSALALRDRYPAIGAGANSRIRLTSRFCSEPRSRQVPIAATLRRPTHRSARLFALFPSPTRLSAGLQPGL